MSLNHENVGTKVRYDFYRSAGVAAYSSAPPAPVPKKKKGGRQKAVRVPEYINGLEDFNSKSFGDYKLFNSSFKTDRTWTNINDLSKDSVDKEVWVRGRVAAVRKVGGKMAFMTLRAGLYTVQVLFQESESIPRAMVKYAVSTPPESVVDILAKVSSPEQPITSTSQQDVELVAAKLFVINASTPELPFQLADASRDPKAKSKDPKRPFTTVSQDTRLNYRWLDVRTQANYALFRINTGVCRFYRAFFMSEGFTEIHTPKIISGTSEGGADVFRLDFFGTDACLSQSPQLYKQAAIMSDLGAGGRGVFEIGPVFRAEDCNTHRHLNEFTGLDFEMEIKDHYHEVLDVLDNLFLFIFDSLNRYYKPEIEAVRKQYGCRPLKYNRKTLVLKHSEVLDMLRVERKKMLAKGMDEESIRLAGGQIEEDGDLSAPNERLLGSLIEKSHDTEFYIVDKYPLTARPFYTMPCPEDPKMSNSYDVFLRGEEITSGAQRVHDPVMLAARAKAHGIPLKSIQWYIDSFKLGAPPHGGAGIGLERVVMLFLGVDNVRKTSLFPRTPSRCTP